MTANHRTEIIRERLRNAFSPTYLEVIDESDQHIGHKGHQGGGRHFAIMITASCFHGQTRVQSHRQIYDLFLDMMPEQIHALRINLIK